MRRLCRPMVTNWHAVAPPLYLVRWIASMSSRCLSSACFVPGVGKRPMVAPDDPRHPKNRLGAKPGVGSPTDADGEPDPASEPGTAPQPKPQPAGREKAVNDGLSRAA